MAPWKLRGRLTRRGSRLSRKVCREIPSPGPVLGEYDTSRSPVKDHPRGHSTQQRADRDGDHRGSAGSVWKGRRICYIAAKNSSTVRPARAMRLLRVPLATVAWLGTERVARWSCFVRMMWLPRCRTTAHPKDCGTRITSRGLRIRIGASTDSLPHPAS